MNTIKDGGPAFPQPEAIVDWGENGREYDKYSIRCAEGMTLRDWFAGQALAGILSEDSQRQHARYVLSKEKGIGPTLLAALEAYQHADAMLAARAKEDKP